MQTLREIVRNYPCTRAARFRGNVSGVQLTPRERCALLSAARDSYNRSIYALSLDEAGADTLNVLSADIIGDPPVAWTVEFRFLGSRTIASVRISQVDGAGQVTRSSEVPSGSGAPF